MLLKTFCLALFAITVTSRHIPRYSDLDEDDQQLFRAAYETPSYNHNEYDEEDDLPLGKLDLLKDGMWVIKAKLKELKAFNKAMAANLLSTKLKLKELIAEGIAYKKHSHVEVVKKPVYYQVPNQPQYAETQYTPTQYAPSPPPHQAYDPYYGH